MSFALFSFREYHGWEEEELAAELSISLDDYRHLESGIEMVDAEMAVKLSKLFKAPPQIFLARNWSNHISIVYSHCRFENSNGYVNHAYCDNGHNFREEILQQLKDEVDRLRKQNDWLLNRLTELC